MVKFILSILLTGLLLPCSAPLSHAEHAFSLYGTPKYPPDFTHFDYVNPDAPKGGALYLANPDRATSFDKFNPFSLKGIAATGVGTLMFETLAVGNLDEITTMYGLLADDMHLSPDRMAMTFHLNSKARFNNGDPVTAADVKYSYDTLLAYGAPQFKSVYADVKQCVVVDAQTVRFDFKTKNHELPLIVGAVPVFSRKWAPGVRFDNIQLTPPISTGPYLIEKFDIGHSITYKRNPAYWGAEVPSRRGMYNFARIQYRFYSDDVARLEAFKVGEFDVMVEYSAKNWMRNYHGAKFDSGAIIKRDFPQSNGAGMQGFVMNLRRPQFQDVRVRRALTLALDFEWLNRQLFYNQYQRIYSYFNNSEMAATGVPQGAELALLKSLQADGLKLDPAVFGPAPVPPKTSPPSSLRANLLQARSLLAQAGWTYRDGALRNAAGDPLRFEILDDAGPMTRIISAYARNLAKLGIAVDQRTADYALLAKRMDDFDFDMTSIRFPDVSSPGNEMFDLFGSKAADQPGSNNAWGLKDPAVDKILAALVAADNRPALNAAARALDRVLLHDAITVPQWYSSTHRIAYSNRLGMPAKLPLYYQADPYVISTWWQIRPKQP